jgi:putative endonuclease
MSCFCYIVQCSDDTLYTGWTVDVERRVKQHNEGKGAKYTKMRRPVKLVYVESQPDKKTALKRERAIKALPRKKKLELFSFNP